MRYDSAKEAGHRGWYITKTCIEAELGDDGNLMAWCKSRAHEPQTFPVNVHVPHYRAKPCKALEILSYTEFLETQVARIDELDMLKTCLCNIIIALRNGHDDDTVRLNVDHAIQHSDEVKEYCATDEMS